MGKKLTDKFIVLIFLGVLMLSGCGKTVVAENSNFTEIELLSERYNPELEGCGGLYFDENGEVKLKRNMSPIIYKDNEKTIYFTCPQTPDAKNSVLRGVTNTGEELYKMTLGEISGIEKIDFTTVPEGGIPDFNFLMEGKVFVLENGNLGIGLDFFTYVKTIEINPYTKELINFVDYRDIAPATYRFTVMMITQNNTIFYNPENGELLLYNNYTGLLEDKTIAPGYEGQSDGFGMGDIVEYQDYWYTITETGVYITMKNTFDWECLVKGSDAKCFKYENLGFVDLVIASEKDIFVLLSSNCNFDGTEATVSFVEFKLK